MESVLPVGLNFFFARSLLPTHFAFGLYAPCLYIRSNLKARQANHNLHLKN
jgi:hypothetical protein